MPGCGSVRRWRRATLLLAVAGSLSFAAPAQAAWSDVDDLSPDGQLASAQHVAVDPNGNAIIVWRRHDGFNYRIQLRVRKPDGALSATQTLSAPGQDAHNPRVAVDPSGNATIVWRRSDGSKLRVQVRRRSAGGLLGGTQTLSLAGESATAPQVAVDAGGNAYVVWSAPDGGIATVQGRARAADGGLGP